MGKTGERWRRAARGGGNADANKGRKLSLKATRIVFYNRTQVNATYMGTLFPLSGDVVETAICDSPDSRGILRNKKG